MEVSHHQVRPCETEVLTTSDHVVVDEPLFVAYDWVAESVEPQSRVELDGGGQAEGRDEGEPDGLQELVFGRASFQLS